MRLDTGCIGDGRPRALLVDAGLPDVEDHRTKPHSSDSTRARSALVVTLSSAGSPSTTAIEPPARSTSAAQSVAPPGPAAYAARSRSAKNACGVCTAIRSVRSTVSTTRPPRTRFSVSPTGQSFSGNYRVSFDLWQNYAGPVGPGGNGTTQLSMFGIGSTGASAAWAGNTTGWASGANGVGFGVTLDGGSSVDYRAYSSAATTAYAEGSPVYASGGFRNGSAAYYAGFGGASAPAAQIALFPGQTGTTEAGEIGFSWRRVDIDVVGAGSAYWYIDGLLIGSVNLSTVTLGGGNLFLGHGDTNAGSSTDPNDSLLNVTIIDNLQVVAIPEPSSLALFGLGGLAFLARRRK